MTRTSRAVMLAALCLGVLLVGIELFITAVALPQIFFDLSGWSELRRASWIVTAYLVAYIAAMPDWKRKVGRHLDALVVRTVPGVRKAVRWNTPFYGVEGQGWFLGFHSFTKYVKVTFLRGASLRPAPPVASKHEDVRYFHVHEDDPIDDEKLASWIRQAAEQPGEELF